MFWADRIAGEIVKRFEDTLSQGEPIIIRDEKTLSGRVHVGSMRGAAVHGAIAEALHKRGIPVTFLWEHNDFDVFDGVPSYLDQTKFEPYLGMLLRDVPSPDGAGSYAEFYAKEFQAVIEQSGFHPTFYWGSEPYVSGKMDGVIHEALEHAQDIRRIYKEVSGGEKPETWLPIQVMCPQCKKIATTWATDFDGETVAVLCRPGDKTAYAKGCGFEGRVSPFGGNAKLPWKPEWAAKWKVHGVMVEGGGKDHSTKGGSRDVANHISGEVFKYEVPFDLPYEFFLIAGKKMSSSKGVGSSAKEISDLLPPKIFRLALLSKDINQAFNFDPEGDTIPVLFDLYDKLALGYKTEKEDDYAKLFELVNQGAVAGDVFLPRFSQIAFLVQMPHLSLEKEVELLKGGSLTDADKKELKERATYASKWLEAHAPEKFVFKLQDVLPEAAKNLSPIQKAALKNLKSYIEGANAMPSGEDMHAKLHSLKEEEKISPADLFSAIYLAFLGKGYGPKAGWFISVLDRDFVLKRLEEVTA